VEVQSGTLRIGDTFNNAGLSRALAGTLELGSGTNSGTYDAAAGGTLQLGGGTFQASAVLTGAGSKRLAGAFNGTLNGEDLIVDSVSGAFTLNGAMNWTNGVMSQAEVTIAPGSVLNISGSADKSM